MKERERKKTIRNKMLVFDFVMCFIFIIIGVMFYEPWIAETLFVKASKLVSYLLVSVMVFVLIRWMVKNYCILLENEKESKEMVENNFKIGIMQEVIPIHADQYEDFILTTLTKMSKFYAVIDDCDSEYVKVYIAYNQENNKYYQFEEVKKEIFKNYYAIG